MMIKHGTIGGALTDQALDGVCGGNSEMSETESLRLQMAMERASKMSSMISNVLKTLAATSAGITQNMK